MNNTKDTLNWAQASERYNNANYIFNSKSQKEAQEKIDCMLRKRKERGDYNVLYYEIGKEILWNEYQFLFMCQFLEFKTAELFYKLDKKGKVKEDFISSLKIKPKANIERANSKGGERILSPASLLYDFRCNFGCLIELLDNKTFDFSNKNELLKKLRKFNQFRIGFTHHSFNSNKGAGNFNLKEIISNGVKLGKESLICLDNLTID